MVPMVTHHVRPGTSFEQAEVKKQSRPDSRKIASQQFRWEESWVQNDARKNGLKSGDKGRRRMPKGMLGVNGGKQGFCPQRNRETETKQFLQDQIPGSFELLNYYLTFSNIRHLRLILIRKIFFQ